MPEDPELIDSLKDDGASFMEDRAHRAGIHNDLIKSTSMSNDRLRLSKGSCFFLTDISVEEKPHLRAAIFRLLFGLRLFHDEIASLKSKLAKSQRASSSQFYLIAGLLCIAFLLFGILKFNDFNITVAPNKGNVIAIESLWWGFVKVEKEIKWMKADDYDFPGWMTEDVNGKWSLYIREEDFKGA